MIFRVWVESFLKNENYRANFAFCVINKSVNAPNTGKFLLSIALSKLVILLKYEFEYTIPSTYYKFHLVCCR